MFHLTVELFIPSVITPHFDLKFKRKSSFYPMRAHQFYCFAVVCVTVQTVIHAVGVCNHESMHKTEKRGQRIESNAMTWNGIAAHVRVPDGWKCCAKCRFWCILAGMNVSFGSISIEIIHTNDGRETAKEIAIWTQISINKLSFCTSFT